MFCQQYLTLLKDFFTQTLNVYTMQDCLEVCTFSYISYKSLIWLKQDHTKNLLLSFYSYLGLLLFAHLSSCTILFHTLLLSAPICIIFVMIIHQKQLQKNFVLSSKTHINLQTTPTKNWLESLLQSCLLVSHQNKNIICIIERSQHLQSLLQAPYLLQAPIKQDLTNLLLASNKISDPCLLWIHESGSIQSINVSWSDTLINELIIKPHNTLSLFHEAALLLTEKTDAIIFSIHTDTDTHTIWYKGSCIKQNTVQQLLQFMNKILKTPTLSSALLKERNNHDQSNTFAS